MIAHGKRGKYISIIHRVGQGMLLNVGCILIKKFKNFSKHNTVCIKVKYLIVLSINLRPCEYI